MTHELDEIRSEVGSINNVRLRNSMESLDTSVMSMADLICWNPEKEPKFELKDLEEEVESQDTKTHIHAAKKSFGPKVMVDADGKLVIDESSLVVAETRDNQDFRQNWSKPSTTNYSSFRKKKPVPVWSKKETELFYDIISRTGPDFGLMHEFFPTRSRNELKSKFKKETRLNGQRLNEILALPITLDKSLYRYADKKIKEMEEEKKRKQKKSKKVVEANSDDETTKPRIVSNREPEFDSENFEVSTSMAKEKRPVSTAVKELLQVALSAICPVPETLKDEKKNIPILKGYGK